ncbi:MAG: AAA family ATPase [Lachnospiraceae bacterium]|nr:AAA family ATPase [Lachnospiraceae bacterium]
MADHDMLSRLMAIQKQIATLPPGSLTKKRVNGKDYYYHRVTVDKKRHEMYVREEEMPYLAEQIDKRKQLEKALKSLKKKALQAGVAVSGHNLEERPAIVSTLVSDQMSLSEMFSLNMLTGEALRSFAAPVRHYKKRACFDQLCTYIRDESDEKVFVLYGLRRTGKTTMIRQILNDMTDAELSRTAFIQLTARDTLADVNRVLKYLAAAHYGWVFLDEVTLMGDFIEGAALFSDIFAACGMKVVLSGTDSLGFLFAEDEQLYDRCRLLHTTFIAYREFENVLGIKGIDEYIRYGGTMSLGGVHYNETSTFADKDKADAYVDSAVARNIQHSLKCYQYGGHFRGLQDLYEAGELTSVINRVVEDLNHRFALEVLTRTFRSHDLVLSAANLRRDRQQPQDILDRVDATKVTETLRHFLDIRNPGERVVALNDGHVREIKTYLDLLELTYKIPIESLPDVARVGTRMVITQPGLRYAQADALIRSLLLDETFSALSFDERRFVKERIISEIKGRMMEDIVLLETTKAEPRKRVFVLQFPVSEFDMVVADDENGTCSLYEIKHSREMAPEQRRHLENEEKCALTEHRFGTITGRYVLYRGDETEVDGIRYLNVEEYLKSLSHS